MGFTGPENHRCIVENVKAKPCGVITLQLYPSDGKAALLPEYIRLDIDGVTDFAQRMTPEDPQQGRIVYRIVDLEAVNSGQAIAWHSRLPKPSKATP